MAIGHYAEHKTNMADALATVIGSYSAVTEDFANYLRDHAAHIYEIDNNSTTAKTVTFSRSYTAFIVWVHGSFAGSNGTVFYDYSIPVKAGTKVLYAPYCDPNHYLTLNANSASLTSTAYGTTIAILGLV